ncbi:MAG: aquaporin [Phycisphaera sp.]|nr:aquaporin [Phycisphaera sp.]
MTAVRDTRPSLPKRSLEEAIGTFALVFVVTGSIIVNDTTGGTVTHVGVSLAFGLVVMAMIYTVGSSSGAHLNPAVSWGFFLSGRFPLREVMPYILSQCVGALAASLLLRALFPEHVTLGATLPVGPWWRAFVLEVVLTAILMYVILHVSIEARETGLMAGIAIGGTVALAALFAGPVCGASMNPARSLAPALVSGRVNELWIYILATPVGASLATVACRLFNPQPGCCGGSCVPDLLASDQS